jgi:argininosuccinate synthase
MKKQVVLAFSGGLDTSFCAVYLSQVKNLSVHTVTVDTGGFTPRELNELAKKSARLGAEKHVCINAVSDYYKHGIKYLLFGNILRNHTYPLSVSAERIFQAKYIAEYAIQNNADYLAHGSTGAGNDQVRFDLIFMIIAPDIPILTPVRDKNLSRQQEITFLQENGVELSWDQVRYSIHQGLWGTSIGGAETLTSHLELPEEAYPTRVEKDIPATISIGFKNGQPFQINDKIYNDPVEVIKEINLLGAQYGIGRDIHIGDTIIGIKGRVAFEASAAQILIKAHQVLEKHVLTKWQIYWKDQLADWYGQLLHEGQYLDPVMRNIEKFLEDSQNTVSGQVHIKLRPYHFDITGVESPYDLMNRNAAAYGETSGNWSGEDVKGFARILANQCRIYHQVNSSLAPLDSSSGKKK